MIDYGVLITGGVGVVTTFISGFVSWFFTRRKYNTEVNSNEIANLKESLDFYKKIVEDNNKRLQFYIDLAETNRKEVYRLKGVVYRLLNNSCLDNNCPERKFFTEEQIGSILGHVILEEDETSSKEKAFQE
jgi:hypothetical protein